MNSEQLLDLSLKFRRKAEAVDTGLTHSTRAQTLLDIAEAFEEAANDLKYPLNGLCQSYSHVLRH